MSRQKIWQERIRASDREWFLCVSRNYWFYSHGKKCCWADTCPTLSKSIFYWFREGSSRTSEDGCWFSGSHSFSSKQGLQTISNQISNHIVRWFCTVSMQWCMGWPQLVPASSFEPASQSSRIQARFLLKMKIPFATKPSTSTSPDSNSHLHIPWSNLSKVVVHFPDLGLSDSWTIVQLKELFRWVFSSKRFCRRLSEWNAKFSFWKWNTE